MTTTLFHREVAPNIEAIATIRHDVEDVLADQSSEPMCSDVVLIVSELCTNAMEATGRSGPPIAVRVEADEDVLVVQVEDCGGGFGSGPPHRGSRKAERAERGRGLCLVLALADELSFSRDEGRTIVRASIGRVQ